MVSTLLEADVGPFEVLNVRRVLKRCIKLKVTLKVYFKQTVAMAIMRVYFCWPSVTSALVRYLLLTNIEESINCFNSIHQNSD